MFGMIDRLTANIRITRKLLIAPGVAVVLLSLMAPLALKSLGDQTRLIERLTTVEASRVLRESGISLEKRAAAVDRLSAVILLQSYLDSL